MDRRLFAQSREERPVRVVAESLRVGDVDFFDRRIRGLFGGEIECVDPGFETHEANSYRRCGMPTFCAENLAKL